MSSTAADDASRPAQRRQRGAVHGSVVVLDSWRVGARRGTEMRGRFGDLLARATITSWRVSGHHGEQTYGVRNKPTCRTAHLRKSATSVPSNIAEGCGRDGDEQISRFLSIAAGSASELEYQLLLAHDLEYLPGDAHSHLSDQVTEAKPMLYRLMQSLTPNG